MSYGENYQSSDIGFRLALGFAFLICRSMKNFLNNQLLRWCTLPACLSLLISCEKGQELPDEAMQGIALQDMLGEEEYWEGTKLEYIDLFFTNDNNLFSLKDSNKTYSGIIKVRSRKGSIAKLESYSSGLKDGDFEYHDNGKLKSKKAVQNGYASWLFLRMANRRHHLLKKILSE